MPAAALAAQPDVGAEPIDQPLAAAAGMGAPEPDDVAQEQLEDGPGRTSAGAYQRRGWPSAGRQVAVPSPASVTTSSRGVT